MAAIEDFIAVNAGKKNGKVKPFIVCRSIEAKCPVRCGISDHGPVVGAEHPVIVDIYKPDISGSGIGLKHIAGDSYMLEYLRLVLENSVCFVTIEIGDRQSDLSSCNHTGNRPVGPG